MNTGNTIDPPMESSYEIIDRVYSFVLSKVKSNDENSTRNEFDKEFVDIMMDGIYKFNKRQCTEHNQTKSELLDIKAKCEIFSNNLSSINPSEKEKVDKLKSQIAYYRKNFDGVKDNKILVTMYSFLCNIFIFLEKDISGDALGKIKESIKEFMVRREELESLVLAIESLFVTMLN